jgi:pSer/pThr/pTyr-binding forkhead associated (FHA) protein
MHEGVAMLFAPPNPPITVPRTRAIVMGRSPTCDLPVPSRRASRRHAEVRREGDAFVVADLGSTNGTFVNGDKIEGDHALKPGDKIDVGGAVVTFCQVQGNIDLGTQSEEEKTVLFEGPIPSADELERQSQELAAAEALNGSLAEIPAVAVMQLLEMGVKTGMIEFTVEGGADLRIWMNTGRIVHAATGDLTGFAAAASVVSIHAGRFQFHPDEAAVTSTVDCAVTEMLLEASRQLDEDGRTQVDD